ncbi:MAG: SoxXA-binding protein [Gammaproteobacteria bacterium]|nr:SoxXA-binding protein [Gammaproteobacteria bacterium]
MKKLSILFALGLATVLATGCASTGGSMDSGSGGDYASIMAQAKAENKKAKKAGGLWRDAGKIMKKAEAAKKAGDDKKALKLAKKALFQGKMGQEQAASQANAGPWLF